MARLSSREMSRRRKAALYRLATIRWMRQAFGEPAFVGEASLIVFTRGQMNGLRATIKRLGLHDEASSERE